MNIVTWLIGCRNLGKVNYLVADVYTYCVFDIRRVKGLLGGVVGWLVDFSMWLF